LVIFALAFLIYESWRFALLVGGLALLQLVLLLLGRLRQKPLLSEGLVQQAREQSYEVELFTGIETVKAMGCEGRALSRWAELFIDVMNNGIAQGRLGAIIEAFGTVLAALSAAAPLLYGSYLALAGKLSLGTMLMVSSVGGSFLTSIGKLCKTILSLQILGAYTARLDEVFDTKPEQPVEGPYPAPRLNGAITLSNVSFRYNELSPFVVRNLSLHIEPGKFIAVVGRSGAGKSTLAYLLLGLYPPTDGTIYLDGINLASLDLRTVRRQLGIVTQTHALFASTIRDNIAMSDPSVPLEDVIRAAQLAQIHDDIVAMPLGYNTTLADRGHSLSGGQRQRLALARALVRQPAMLLLDEATSALDAATERKVQIALGQLPCTRVVIAHRLSTVIHADVILVIEGGLLAEAGTHDQLLAHGGIYAQLFAAQASAAAAG
jgi:ABC-type bacteriocin/lantibiotic exporter with double-glycine peptidase domain